MIIVVLLKHCFIQRSSKSLGSKLLAPTVIETVLHWLSIGADWWSFSADIYAISLMKPKMGARYDLLSDVCASFSGLSLAFLLSSWCPSVRRLQSKSSAAYQLASRKFQTQISARRRLSAWQTRTTTSITLLSTIRHRVSRGSKFSSEQVCASGCLLLFQ